MGAGEILLTSMDHDGTKNGFAVELTESAGRALVRTGDCFRRRRKYGTFFGDF